MFNVSHIRRVFVVEYKINLQKGHDGLLAEVYRLGLNPWARDLVIFPGRCRRKIKILFSDRNGLWVGYKKFTDRKMLTKLNFLNEISSREIRLSELQLFLEGSAFTVFETVDSKWPLTKSH